MQHRKNRPPVFVTRMAPCIILLGAGLATSTNSMADEPLAPPSLGSVSLPLPSQSNIREFLKSEYSAIQLGKALFWDMAVGSDGVACASCHFHAGADNRIKNQLNPGTRRMSQSDLTQSDPDTNFEPTASGGFGGPNYTLQWTDFPFHQFNNPDSRHSGVKFSSNDVSSSQGSFGGTFTDVPMRNVQNDECDRFPDPVFHVGSVGVRKVEPRNAPSTYNAIFNFRNFWDGRANNNFNGVDQFGRRNEFARIFRNDGTPVRVDLNNASVASQAVSPTLSDLEMVCTGRNNADLGRKMISRQPLATQKVHYQDSLLGHLRAGEVGLNGTYRQMIQRAFVDKWWNGYGDFDGYTQMEANFSLFWGLSLKLYQATLVSDKAPYDLFAEDKDEPFDPSRGDDDFLTEAQLRGLDVFLDQGKCITCHKGAEFSGAASNLQKENEENGLVERMRMGDNGIALYDQGFYNIGVTPTHEDIGVGGLDAFGNPLSFTEQYVNSRFVDRFEVDTCTFEEKFTGSTIDPYSDFVTIYTERDFQGEEMRLQAGSYDVNDLGSFDKQLSSIRVPDGWKVSLYEDPGFSGSSRSRYSDDDWSTSFNNRTSSIIVRDATGSTERDSCGESNDLANERVAVMGAFKTPILRNVELTGPYMHNGSMATLEQVVEFYNRGGNFKNNELDADIRPLGLTSRQKSDLVAFLKSLTDPRVANSEAPFDHPQLFVPNGHPGDEFNIYEVNSLSADLAGDDWMEVQAVGRYGRTQEGLERLKPFQPAGIKPVPVYNGPPITVYSDSYFRGDSLSLLPGHYDVDVLGRLNDRITSVRVPEGMRVEMYENPGFTGSVREDSEDDRYTVRLNNEVSSIIVYAD